MNTSARLGKLALLSALSVVVVGVYSSWGRPMGIDEVLHFALGSMTPADALATIYESTGPHVNHGQTGFLMFINYLLLQVGGASLLALRLPSIIAAGIMLASAIYFLRRQSLAWPWQTLVVMAFAAQSGLMFFAGEGRPYMILASTTVATLAYFQIPAAQRRRWPVVLFGFYAIVIGFANHPYYAFMYVTVLAFTIFMASVAGGSRPTWGEVRRVADLPLLGIGVVLYIILGALTWMRGTPVFDFDPWGPIGGPATALKVLVASHAELLGSLPELKIFVIALLVITSLVVYSAHHTKPLLPPIALIALGVATSLAFSAASFVRDYWILPRQWVAGIALGTIGFVWLISELYKLARTNSSFFLSFASLGIAAYITVTGVSAAAAALASTTHYPQYWEDLAVTKPDPDALARQATTNGDWVEAANANVLLGGPVAENLSRYYRSG